MRESALEERTATVLVTTPDGSSGPCPKTPGLGICLFRRCASCSLQQAVAELVGPVGGSPIATTSVRTRPPYSARYQAVNESPESCRSQSASIEVASDCSNTYRVLKPPGQHNL